MNALSAGTRRELDSLRVNWKAMLLLAAVVIAYYVLATSVQPGWVTYVLSAVALLFMCVTSLASLNDTGCNGGCRRTTTRLLGFVLAGLAAVTLLGMPLNRWDPPSWTEVLLRWSIVLVWITAPGQKPWWTWIWGLTHHEDHA